MSVNRIVWCALAVSLLSGCATLIAAIPTILGVSNAGVIGAAGAAQNFEYQKLIEVLPRYDGLEHHSVAVLVDAPLDLQYTKPELLDQVAGGLMSRLQEHVPDIKMLHPLQVRNWQFSTPQWNAMAFGEMADELGVPLNYLFCDSAESAELACLISSLSTEEKQKLIEELSK